MCTIMTIDDLCIIFCLQSSNLFDGCVEQLLRIDEAGTGGRRAEIPLRIQTILRQNKCAAFKVHNQPN